MEHESKADLATLHFLSLLTKFFQIAAVLVQGMIVNRLLHPAGRGLVETAMSVGAAVGVLQNLGFVSSTVREIATTTDEQRRAATFLVSLGVRGLIGLPTALILWAGAGYIAGQVVQEPTIVTALRIYGFTILFTAVFQTCEATLIGLQHFQKLFLFYVLNAIVNLVATVALVALRQFNGYFIGQAIAIALGTLLLIWIVLNALQWRLMLPRNRRELLDILRALFTIALVVYITKVLYAQYTGIGAVILRRYVSAEQVGYFSNGKQIALHFLNIAEAANIVNLSVMSQRFTEGLDVFRVTVRRNFAQLLALILYAGTAATLFSRELVLITAGAEFLPATEIAPWLIVAFVFYSFVHITSAGVLVPSNSNRAYIISYMLLLGVSAPVIWLLVASGWGIRGGSLGLLVGALASALYLLLFLWRRFRITILDGNLVVILASLLPMWAAYITVQALALRMAAFLASSLCWAWAIQRLGIFDLRQRWQGLWGRLRRGDSRIVPTSPLP